MKKAMKKKLVTLGLVCMMTAGVRTAVFADEVPAENEVSPVEHVTKHFEMAEGIAAPDVTFSFTAAKVTSDAPNAVIRDLTYTSSDAAVATNGLVSLDKTTEITFEEFPHAVNMQIEVITASIERKIFLFITISFPRIL